MQADEVIPIRKYIVTLFGLWCLLYVYFLCSKLTDTTQMPLYFFGRKKQWKLFYEVFVLAQEVFVLAQEGKTGGNNVNIAISFYCFSIVIDSCVCFKFTKHLSELS